MHLQERDFTIVFRSFGQDIPDVMEEMNMFCTGQHPFHPQVTPVGVGGVDSKAFSAFLLWLAGDVSDLTGSTPSYPRWLHEVGHKLTRVHPSIHWLAGMSHTVQHSFLPLAGTGRACS